MWWARLWVQKIEAGLEAGATPLDVSEGDSSASKLRGKLGQFDAAMAGKVDEVLVRYHQHRSRRWR